MTREWNAIQCAITVMKTDYNVDLKSGLTFVYLRDAMLKEMRMSMLMKVLPR